MSFCYGIMLGYMMAGKATYESWLRVWGVPKATKKGG